MLLGRLRGNIFKFLRVGSCPCHIAVNNTTETVVEEVVYSKEEDKEWYARFFDEARYISDEELQIVWGRLLAERMMHPAGVNNRALYFIRDLDKTEIETIRRSMRVFLNNGFAPDGVINDLVGMDYDIPVLLSLGIYIEVEM